MAFFRGDPTKIGGRPLLVPTPDSIEANGLLPLEQSEGDLYQLTGASGDDVTRVVIHAGQLGEVGQELAADGVVRVADQLGHGYCDGVVRQRRAYTRVASG